MFWQSWQFALNVTLPGILLLVLGFMLRRRHWLDENFNHTAARLVFYIALPCLVFFSIANNQADISRHYSLAIYGAISTVMSYLLLESLAPWLVKKRTERGIFVQAGFRSNTAIMGLTYCSIAYGSEGVILGSIYLVSTVILFNILSIVTLSRTLSEHQSARFNLIKLVKDIVSNPIIVAILAGLVVSYCSIELPQPVRVTGQFLSGLTLPLAMMCAGANIQLQQMYNTDRTAIYATIARSVVIPVLITLAAFLCGFHGIELGVIFLLSSTPTAAASYIMVKTMGGNATLAANIIALTTVSCFFTTVIGLFLLHHFALI